jgi:hypothetical protein
MWRTMLGHLGLPVASTVKPTASRPRTLLVIELAGGPGRHWHSAPIQGPRRQSPGLGRYQRRGGAAQAHGEDLTGPGAFLEGHVLEFEYFGAVPGRVRYDNLGPAVVRVLRGRDPQGGFGLRRVTHTTVVRKSASQQRQACSSQRYGQADPALVIKVRAVLDFEDFTRLGGRKLSLGSHGYAQMRDDKPVTLVHRWVVGAKPRDGRIVDTSTATGPMIVRSTCGSSPRRRVQRQRQGPCGQRLPGRASEQGQMAAAHYSEHRTRLTGRLPRPAVIARLRSAGGR